MSIPFAGHSKSKNCSDVVAALCDTLNELAQAIDALGSDRYAQPTGPSFGNSTVGMHVRHALDHVRVLVQADTLETTNKHINYDSRHRGTDIETSLDAAQAEIARLCEMCESLKAHPCDSSVTIVSLASKNTEPIVLQSTLGRECAFVLSHTIHHNAMVRSMAIALHSQVPDSLGCAPSTPTGA